MELRGIPITEKVINRFWKYVDKSKDCWMWVGSKNKQGYGRFGIASGICVNATRLSYVIANNGTPEGLFVCHKCDNPSCVRPDHLFAGTRQDNINDMMIKKRSKHFKNHQFYGIVWDDRAHEGDDRKGRWRSFICIKEKIRYLSRHTSVIEAARNYDRIAYIVYGERERLNFPEDYILK